MNALSQINIRHFHATSRSGGCSSRDISSGNICDNIMSDGSNIQEELDTVFGENDFSSSYNEHDSLKARIFKIIVIGDSNVGKTCLTFRFCGGAFLKNPEATIGVDFRERTVNLDGESIKVRRSSPGFNFYITNEMLVQ